MVWSTRRVLGESRNPPRGTYGRDHQGRRMTDIRRSALAFTTTLVCALGLVSTASAATTTPGAFTFDVTTAKVGIGPVPSLPINAATLGGQSISLTGTVDADGRLSVPKDKIAFPAITIPIPQEVLTALAGALSGSGTGGLDLGSLLGGLLGGGATTGATTAAAAAPADPAPAAAATTPAPDLTSILALVKDVSVTAGISGTGPAAGTVDPASGATTLDLGLGIGVGINATASLGFFSLPVKDLVTCGISPIPFKLTTGSVTVPGKATTLTGTPYDPATGLVTLVGAVDTPAPGCKLNSLVGSLLGGPNPLDALTTASLGAATVELTGKLAVAPATPPVVTPPVTSTTTTAVVAPPVKKVAAALLKLAKTIKVSGKTVAVKIACQVVDCTGSVKVATVTATSAKTSAKPRTLGSRRYRAKAGRTTTVKVTLTKAARALLKKKHKAKVRVTASVSGGKPAQRTVTLTVPAAKKR